MQYRFLKTTTPLEFLEAVRYDFSSNAMIFDLGDGLLFLDRDRNCVSAPSFFSITI